MESATNKVEGNNIPGRGIKKSGKEDKPRRKDDKNVDQVMKSLNNMETTEEKLAAICKKYSEVVDENRKLQLVAKQWEKGVTTLQRDKEQIQADHSKAVLTRSRLESLCRELQRQNKAVKEESLLKVREEEEKRKEVSAKFNATLAEITSLMSSSNEKTNKLRDENVDITKKFRSICEQSGLQQQQVDKMNMQRKLEAELSEAKLTKQKLEFTAEKEILLRDKQQLLMELQEARGRANDLVTNEKNLKTQVALYADRYEEFQNALSRSNEVFGGFKGEMDKMSKKIVKLEKETLSWKSRWEKSHQALLEMAADKQQRDAELALVTRQLAQLQKLCRTLQTERVGLLAQVKGLDKTPDMTEPLLPEIKPEDIAMLSAKEPECPALSEEQSTSAVDSKGSKGAQSKSNKKAKLTAEPKLNEALKDSHLTNGLLNNDDVNNTAQETISVDNAGHETITSHLESEPINEELKVNNIVAENAANLPLTDANDLLPTAASSEAVEASIPVAEPAEEIVTDPNSSPAKSTKEDLNIATQRNGRSEPELKHKKPQKQSIDHPVTQEENFEETESTAIETPSVDDLSPTPDAVPLDAALPSPVPVEVGPDPVLDQSDPAVAPSPTLLHQQPAQEAPSAALPSTEEPTPIPVQPKPVVSDSKPVNVVPTEAKKGKEGAKKRKK